MAMVEEFKDDIHKKLEKVQYFLFQNHFQTIARWCPKFQALKLYPRPCPLLGFCQANTSSRAH